MVMPCTTVSALNYEVLLYIFDWYRLYNTTDDDQTWNLERWWYKPIHVCRKWRYLILSSPTRLDLHLVCTHGIPVKVMLSHSPPLPLIINYRGITSKTSAADQESALFALQQRERVRRIHIAAPTAILRDLFKAMDDEWPMLERLALHSWTESRTGLVLPEKLQAPLLRDLTLSNIAIPIQSPLLRQAGDLVTLTLRNVPASPEFHPAHLIAQLSGMSRLEILKIHFYAAIPNRGVERRLRSVPQLAPITLPSLKTLAFRGGSAYLEGILARLSAPLLLVLNVEFFNQLTFHLGHLLQFARTIGQITFRFAEMHFEEEFVSVTAGSPLERTGKYPFLVQVRCQPLDWQAACAAQICHALEPLLDGVDSLTFGFHRDNLASWQDEVDHVQWHGLLRTFDRVKNLQLSGGLVRELFRHLQRGSGELPSVLLLGLRELKPAQALPLPITAYCDRCYQWFPHDHALEQHEDSVSHWACNDSDLDFESYALLRQHYIQSKNHHYCKECYRHFKSDDSRRQHMDDKHWYCREHDRVFKSEPKLHSHYRQSTDHHYCFECEEDFDDEDELWDHLVDDHDACKDCHELFDSYSELQEHDHEVHDYCTECGRGFQNQHNLRLHLNSKLHRPSNIVCPGRKCNKSFISAAALTLHFESGVCRSGMTRERLNRLVVRADKNNYITNPSRLIGGPPGGYEPPMRTSAWATELSWNGMEYECFLCHSTFKTIDRLNQHLKSPAHDQKIYRCPKPDCGVEFVALSALCQHVERGSCGVRMFRQVQNAMESLTRGFNAISV